MKSVNLKVDPELWKEAKVEALKQGKKLQVFVAEALREKLKNGKDGKANA